MSVSLIDVGPKSVILIDVRKKTPEQIEEVRQTLQDARELIKAAEEKSVYIITDLTKSSFNPELVKAFNDFVSENTKFVKTSVLVGLSDHHKVIVSIFKKLHKREFYLADTLDDARKYLWSIK